MGGTVSAAMTNPTTISVLVVDDHRLMAESLAAALASEPDLEVVGIAGTSEEAVDLVRSEHPGVVLMDFRLPDTDGANAAAEVRAVDPSARVVMLSGFNDDTALNRAIDAGCSGFIHKTADLDTVVDAVRRAASGEPIFSATDLSRLVRQLRGETPVGSDLTTREREVLQLLAEGATTEALADRLFISKHTARSHVRNILAKLGAHSKLEAVAIALRAGLVTVDQE
jgi:DNA-binding NarL/FixJ family response regulator